MYVKLNQTDQIWAGLPAFTIADMQSTNKARHLIQSGDAAYYIQSTMIGYQDFCLLSIKPIPY